MRIAVVTETYPPEVNGVALTVASFVDQLCQLGHEVLLARPRQPRDPEPALNGHAVDELLVRGAGLPRYPGLRFGFPSGTRLRRQWSAAAPDAVYIATEGPLGWSALRTARTLGLPTATGFHTRFDDFAAHYGLGWLTPAVFGWLRRFHNRAGATLVPTRELQRFLEESGFERVQVLTRGVDTQLFTPQRRDDALRGAWGAASDDPVVIHLGRIAPEKNLELAVRAFAAIRARVPRARFVWVGDGPALAGLRREHPEFIYCGVQRGTDLARHFASADLFLFPSLTETFGNVTLEAMASGVPVVAYDYGAAREHVEDRVHGRVVPLGDADGFVAAAVELGVDGARRAAMRSAVRRAVEHRSPAQVARDLAGLLAELRARGVGR
jgi:glycosyltransferase involved in cell wall biosynthesis